MARSLTEDRLRKHPGFREESFGCACASETVEVSKRDVASPDVFLVGGNRVRCLLATSLERVRR